MREGWPVTILDNLSRSGAAMNLDWLNTIGRFELMRADVRDAEAVGHAVSAGGP